MNVLNFAVKHGKASPLPVVLYMERIEREKQAEKRRTTKFGVRVVVETESFKDWDWSRLILAEHELTVEQRDRMIGNLAWLGNI